MEKTANGQPANILLVEDNSGDARITMEVLDDCKVSTKVSLAKDGVEAMSFLRREGKFRAAPRPDLILLDLNLPRRDGREVLTDIKEDADLGRIPVIVLSTSASEQDIHWAYEHHCNSYITKPGDLDEFITVIRSIEDLWLSTVTLPTRQPGR